MTPERDLKKSEERQQKLIWYHANRLRDEQQRTIWEEYGTTVILCSTYMIDMCYAYMLYFHARSCIPSSARKSFLCAEYTELGSYSILSFHYHRGGLIPASNLPRQVRKAWRTKEEVVRTCYYGHQRKLRGRWIPYLLLDLFLSLSSPLCHILLSSPCLASFLILVVCQHCSNW